MGRSEGPPLLGGMLTHSVSPEFPPEPRWALRVSDGSAGLHKLSASLRGSIVGSTMFFCGGRAAALASLAAHVLALGFSPSPYSRPSAAGRPHRMKKCGSGPPCLLECRRAS